MEADAVAILLEKSGREGESGRDVEERDAEEGGESVGFIFGGQLTKVCTKNVRVGVGVGVGVLLYILVQI